ncbi:MAG TPA: S28 family serine protease [Kofleriaceae bacterium]|jgi:hypothetical protein
MVRFLALAALLTAGCGDHGPDRNAPAQLLAALQALPNVNDVTQMPTKQSGFTYFVLHFVQPVDHADPASGTFLQEVSLIHKDLDAPLIVQTSGYSDYYLDTPVELTTLLGANQISIEHRFFGTSRPDPADWTKLTIEQMADDEHAIVTALATVYTAPIVATGGSKGGMTSIFYRRFFPDDVAGTVPYVAPISLGAPDMRYPSFIAQVGTADCRAAVRAAAVEMLQNRRAALESNAMAEAADQDYVYTRVPIGPAVESAVVSLEWSFWQYYGIADCNVVPAVTATDDAMWQFLDAISPVSSSDDDSLAAFEAYDYQAYFQLGYPDDGTDAYLGSYEMYSDVDYDGSLPVGVAAPAYDGGAAMQDITSWLASEGDTMLAEYGQWDPWTGGELALGGAVDSAVYVEPEGTHDSDLEHLGASDESAAFARLAGWTGVTPTLPPATRAAIPRVRVPRLHGRHLSP